MNRIAIVMILFCGMPAAAQVIETTDRGIAVAHGGTVELYDENLARIWTAPGLQNVSRIIAGPDRIALLDSWNNQIRLVLLADGSGTTVDTGETPIDGVFDGRDLIVIERDAGTVSRYAAGGAKSTIAVAPDPSAIGRSNGRTYVYSRSGGLLQELVDFRVARAVPVRPFASDLELSGKAAYLLYPRDGEMASVNLDTFEVEFTAAGGAPADLAVIRNGTALSAPLVAIADPAAKRVWTVEGAQSVGAAFGRGFLRGLLGLGLFRPRGSEFPTGVDRIASAGGVTAAYDSVSRTLYRIDATKSRPVAKDLEGEAFTISRGSVVVWRDDALIRAN